jgi:hypothetical protein
MHLANFLKLNVPFGQLFRCEVKAIALMSDIMILTENAAKIAPGEEYGA